MSETPDRYHRQTLLPGIGKQGQARLAASRVLLVGCGALGSVVAEQLVRAGVGTLRIVDRDIVELTNLQRQVLFEESDAREGLPKAVAARQRLSRVNSTVTIDALVVDLHAGNVEELAGLERGGQPFDLIIDGTDSVETRYLLNDVSVKHSMPWIYGACVGTEGRMMTIRPPATACLRCIFPQPPSPSELPTCDTSGVLGPVASVVASLQSTAAIKLLSGNGDAVAQELVSLDLWRNRIRTTPTTDAKRPDCPACGQRRFDFLQGSGEGRSTSLCGRNAVQVRPSQSGARFDLGAVAAKLARAGQVQTTPYLVRCELADSQALRLTVFPDGRLIVTGTTDLERARSIYARYVGS